MTLVPHDEELTIQEAADLLHVSRPYLVKLFDAETFPHHKVRTHRRFRIEDVLDYREQRAKSHREELDELTRLSEVLGQLPPAHRSPERAIAHRSMPFATVLDANVAYSLPLHDTLRVRRGSLYGVSSLQRRK